MAFQKGVKPSPRKEEELIVNISSNLPPQIPFAWGIRHDSKHEFVALQSKAQLESPRLIKRRLSKM